MAVVAALGVRGLWDSGFSFFDKLCMEYLDIIKKVYIFALTNG